MNSSWTSRKNQGPGTQDTCFAEGKGSLGEAAATSKLLAAASELPASGSHNESSGVFNHLLDAGLSKSLCFCFSFPLIHGDSC